MRLGAAKPPGRRAGDNSLPASAKLRSKVPSVSQARCGVTTTFFQCKQRVKGIHRLVGEHVEPGRTKAPVPQRLGQRQLVHEPAPRGVHQNRAALHPRKRRAVDQPLGFRGTRDVQRDHVGLGRPVRRARPAWRDPGTSPPSRLVLSMEGRRRSAASIRTFIAPCAPERRLPQSARRDRAPPRYARPRSISPCARCGQRSRP
jgi:hypothetical protein